MIPSAIDKIDLSTLQGLVTSAVPESRTLEYKQDWPGNSESSKSKFLAQISAFANSQGGDLLIGVKEDSGIASEVMGIDIANLDAETQRLENTIRDGLEPRLPMLPSIRALELPTAGKYVLVIRVARSWVAPHRVKANSKFYGRNSNGKYELDVGELRSQFNLSETVAERIRAFRADRIIKIHDGDTPVQLEDGGRMVLHLVPLSSFSTFAERDVVAEYTNLPLNGPPFYGSFYLNGKESYNLEGMVTYKVGNNVGHASTYVQLFHSGAIEFVEAKSANEILGTGDELGLIERVKDLLSRLELLEVGLPVCVLLSLVGMRDSILRLGAQFLSTESGKPLEKEVASFPEIMIDSHDGELPKVMRSLLNVFYNAYGYSGSPSFDSITGNWRGGDNWKR